jgi:hypothetical protein
MDSGFMRPNGCPERGPAFARCFDLRRKHLHCDVIPLQEGDFQFAFQPDVLRRGETVFTPESMAVWTSVQHASFAQPHFGQPGTDRNPAMPATNRSGIPGSRAMKILADAPQDRSAFFARFRESRRRSLGDGRRHSSKTTPKEPE